jgi:antitoxin component of RelBE/YafQ-DinJ toxin-antitoxin module
MQEKMDRMNITIDQDTREKLEQLCNRMKVNMSAYLRMLVNQQYDRLANHQADQETS